MYMLKICVVEEALSDPEYIDFENSKFQLTKKEDGANAGEMGAKVRMIPRELGHARAAIVKKMLTEKSSQPLSFIRGTTVSRSWRATSKKGDSLQYIVDQHKAQVKIKNFF